MEYSNVDYQMFEVQVSQVEPLTEQVNASRWWQPMVNHYLRSPEEVNHCADERW